MWVTWLLCVFRVVIEGKAGQKMYESSRLEFSYNVSANNFVLSDAKENTPGLLNRGGTAALSLLRIDSVLLT